MSSRWLVAGLLACALLLFAALAAAAQSRVAIVRPKKPSAEIAEATTRLAAELRTAGFDVVLVDARAGIDARAQVEQTKLEPKPFATIALVGTERGAAADVWVADHLSDKTSVRRVDVAADAAVPSALAIRAVELLRASLLEVTSTRRPGAPVLPDDVARWMAAPPGTAAAPVTPSAGAGSPGTAAIPGASASPGAAAVLPPGQPVSPPVAAAPRPDAGPATTPPPGATAARSGSGDGGRARGEPGNVARDEPAARRRRRAALLDSTSIESGAALLQGFRGFGSAFAPTLRLTLPLPLGFAARTALVGPAIGEELSAAAGSTALRQELVTAEVVRAFGDDGEALFVPLLSAGLGGYHLHAQGRGEQDAGYSGVSVDAWALAILGGGGLAARINESAALSLDVRALALVPEPIVRIAEVEAGRAGAPMLLVTLGVVASF